MNVTSSRTMKLSSKSVTQSFFAVLLLLIAAAAVTATTPVASRTHGDHPTGLVMHRHTYHMAQRIIGKEPHMRLLQEGGIECTLLGDILNASLTESGWQGSCSCSGNSSTAITYGCDIPDICNGDDAGDEICGSVRFELTFSGLDINPSSPIIIILFCLQATGDELEWFDQEFCQTLEFDSDSLQNCDVTYGGTPCTCNIDESDNCFQWDCAAAVDDPVQQYARSDSCQGGGLAGDSASGAGSGAAVQSGTAFLPSIQNIPPEELPSGGGMATLQLLVMVVSAFAAIALA